MGPLLWCTRARLVDSTWVKISLTTCDQVHKRSRPIISLMRDTCVCPAMTPLCKGSEVPLYYTGLHLGLCCPLSMRTLWVRGMGFQRSGLRGRVTPHFLFQDIPPKSLPQVKEAFRGGFYSCSGLATRCWFKPLQKLFYCSLALATFGIMVNNQLHTSRSIRMSKIWFVRINWSE